VKLLSLILTSNHCSVVIEGGVQYATEATALAQQECQKYERHAQLKSDKQDMVGWIWTYDCVE
jgi:hypothetical protein